jgi:RND superfamily putative drug exporter
MTLLGKWNWWAPAPLRRLHDRLGLHETPALPAAPAALAAVAVASTPCDSELPVAETDRKEDLLHAA